MVYPLYPVEEAVWEGCPHDHRGVVLGQANSAVCLAVVGVPFD